MNKTHIPEGWIECKLGDVADVIGGGTPKTTEVKYWGGDIPWLSVVDFNNSKKYVRQTEKTITELGFKNSSAKFLEKGDIIISARGTIGALSVLKERMTFNQSCYGIRANELSCNVFLYYLIIQAVNILRQMSHGAVFDTITKKTFDNIAIQVPSNIQEQEAIAEILSSLDDKIDLLHRQNETLEQLAETLFRHHFIENAQDDWEERPLSYFGNIICGKTPSKKQPDYFGGHIPFIKIPDMHNKAFIIDTSDTLTREGLKSQIKKTIPPFSICISCIATVGLVSMNVYESQTNQQINSIIPNEEIYRYFLFCLLRRLKKELINMAIGGTTTLNLNTGNFSKMKVISPNKSLIENFHILVEPFFTKILTNQKQIQTLEKLRDTLLPKLISGQIRVEL